MGYSVAPPLYLGHVMLICPRKRLMQCLFFFSNQECLAIFWNETEINPTKFGDMLHLNQLRSTIFHSH